MEKRDLYDANRNLTGEFIYAGEPIPKDRHYLIVVIFIQNSQGQFLLQKRSLAKGGKWATTGGHPKQGESSLMGIYTEVKEELGLDISGYQSLEMFKSVKDKYCFVDLYYLKADIDINSLILEKEEVQDVKWFDELDIADLIQNNEFFKSHLKMYNDCQKYLNTRLK